MAGLRQYAASIPRKISSSAVAVVSIGLAMALLPAATGVAGALDTTGTGRVAAPAPGSLLPPVTPACISSPFGPRRLVGPRAATFHNGIDFPAPEGAFVHAAIAGRIVMIRKVNAEGLAVDVQTSGPDGVFLTRYAHLGMIAPAIAEGRRDLAAGMVLGRVGRTGITYGTHVHFELHLQGKPVDPEPFFRVARCS